MCNGLAVIVERTDNEWKVYAKKGESSHDNLLHELRDGLRYGTDPHLKFEVIFPNQVRDDIQHDVEYPDGWTVLQFGKETACVDVFCAVFEYLHKNPELLEFLPKMLSKANLSKANLSEANLSEADLSEAYNVPEKYKPKV